MSKQNSREEMREAIKSVAEKTQYMRENLHKPFNGSTKFVTIATVTGLGAFHALIDQAIINPIESSFEKDILALVHCKAQPSLNALMAMSGKMYPTSSIAVSLPVAANSRA